MTESRFLAGMAILGEQCPHPPITDGRLSLYREFLKDLSDDEFQRAVHTSILEGKDFFPTAGHLRDLARPPATATEIAPLFDAIEDRCNSYDPVIGRTWSARAVEDLFGAHARAAFVACGGSPTFERLYQGNNRVFAQKAFAEAYQESQRNGDRDRLLGPVPDSIAQLVAGIVKARQLPKKARA